MEDGIETDGAEAIEQLHHEAIAQADASVVSDAPLETAGNPAAGPGGEQPIDTSFCRDVIALICRQHAEGVRKTFVSKIEPVAGLATAQRIADRAAMSPAIQEQVAVQGAAVLDKYGLAKYICAEAALGAALLTYYFEYASAKSDLEKILNPQPQ
jgi:hypothetical protein